ncbi:Rrf2 family transcriptional regulator, partial [Vibrio parahaemolyticus]|nr:Rrf2 family transcriptional regulator [Vibrio parahaemolyticus]
PMPVSAKALAARHNLPPRYLEPVLQALVRQGVLKGVRGPRGGYELARERRRVTAGDIVRIAMSALEEDGSSPMPESRLAEAVVSPLVHHGTEAFLAELDKVTVEDLCQKAQAEGVVEAASPVDFTI